jgi:hypothetical protein
MASETWLNKRALWHDAKEKIPKNTVTLAGAIASVIAD